MRYGRVDGLQRNGLRLSFGHISLYVSAPLQVTERNELTFYVHISWHITITLSIQKHKSKHPLPRPSSIAIRSYPIFSYLAHPLLLSRALAPLGRRARAASPGRLESAALSIENDVQISPKSLFFGPSPPFRRLSPPLLTGLFVPFGAHPGARTRICGEQFRTLSDRLCDVSAHRAHQERHTAGRCRRDGKSTV